MDVASSNTTSYTGSVPGGSADGTPYANAAGDMPAVPATIDPRLISSLPAEQSQPYITKNANAQYAPTQTYPPHEYGPSLFGHTFAMTPHVTQKANVQHAPVQASSDVYAQAPFGHPPVAT
ncbi:uncharacterized protein B0H18DRAFT_986915 [Fomitopsis serialis]|uniref:uncharacterized protein n=1 Tax=Fomitopsis serialis TaxID=139415 RepID=UPI00200812AF|nr:uncharacterized protein B0H18DRAFT_986915 [Neoantrodia serialis]KAH9932191.1 hypothetical protein B0H18DRAFT_986915 [Neoantrodia serialis]